MVKNEGIFMPFWLRHYGKTFAPGDMYVHSDSSTDDTESQVVSAHANFVAVPPGTIAVGQNDKYVKRVIADLLNSYECVLFAESPDDIIVPGPSHDHNLWRYIVDFLSDDDQYRFLSGVNIIQGSDEPAYDPDRNSSLLAQRQYAVRCPQYDNAFLWKSVPQWGRGWHDLGAGRLEGMGDAQGEGKRLYNLHIHYADFDLCNRRHHVRQATYDWSQREAYISTVDDDLKATMKDMLERPDYWFSNGKIVPVEPWMSTVI